MTETRLNILHNGDQPSGAVLTPKQELLLMSFHDNQCGFLACWKARRLLERSAMARDFLADLKVVSRGIQHGLTTEVPVLQSSLWSAISQRIDQEERAAVYLGSRADRPVRRSFFSSGVSFGWGLTGGAVAAGVTLLIANSVNYSAPQFSPSTQMARDGGSFSAVQQGIPQVIDSTLVGDPVSSRSGSRQRQQSVDVDWVRSDGAVRFFSDPSQRSTMIWVKKRSPVVRFFSPPGQTFTPQGEAYFSEQSAAVTEQPQIIERRVPQSFSVGNR